MHNSITIYGTTFSGNPLRTTLGNSMRVYTYLQYYARHAGVKITPFVAGDDCLVIVDKRDAQPFIQAVLDLSYRRVPDAPTPPKGLGQVYKKFYAGGPGHFLSHDVWPFPNAIDMVRIPQSMVKCGQWTIGEVDDTA